MTDKSANNNIGSSSKSQDNSLLSFESLDYLLDSLKRDASNRLEAIDPDTIADPNDAKIANAMILNQAIMATDQYMGDMRKARILMLDEMYVSNDWLAYWEYAPEYKGQNPDFYTYMRDLMPDKQAWTLSRTYGVIVNAFPMFRMAHINVKAIVTDVSFSYFYASYIPLRTVMGLYNDGIIDELDAVLYTTSVAEILREAKSYADAKSRIDQLPIPKSTQVISNASTPISDKSFDSVEPSSTPSLESSSAPTLTSSQDNTPVKEIKPISDWYIKHERGLVALHLVANEDQWRLIHNALFLSGLLTENPNYK